MVLQEEKQTVANGSWSPSSQKKLGAKGSRFLQQSRPASQLSDYLMADIYLVIESPLIGFHPSPVRFVDTGGLRLRFINPIYAV